jgi:hypothetical protein
MKAPIRKIDRILRQKGIAENILRESEIDLYSEFLAPSETRFSKTNIFVEYKEFHNRKNIHNLNRS